MVEHWGGASNRWDEFFVELERWEEVLSQRSEFFVDDQPEGPNPPG